ncbi:MAG: excinuclease ABC subunit UvrC [Candidatus Limiplasma sp.]|nr:excinuclease ABC subunit UvrC [Candidatus Limiplasma sp.]
MNDTLAHKLKTLPGSPGCYLMKNQGKIIYVGKAVNLKNRVRQYFHESAQHTPKVRWMVQEIDDFDIILCDTNFEALTLECNLIKKHRPFYNILLRDDKHYPYLRLDPREPFPRLTVARQIDPHDGAKYFGPYYAASGIRQVLEEVRRFFPLRTCALNLPLKQPRRPCVHHQIGQCLAPCANLVSQEEYAKILKNVLAFLGGDTRQLREDLTRQMREHSRKMEFEQAAVVRDKLAEIDRMMEKQHAIQTKDAEQDLIAAVTDGTDALVQITHIRGGRMEGSRGFVMEDSGQEDLSELTASFLTQYYDDEHLIPQEILVQDLPKDPELLHRWLREKKGGAVALASPQRGDKRQLMELCLKNARENLAKHSTNKQVRFRRTTGAMQELQEVLGLPGLPLRIEGYDISNTQGAQSVAAMVVFENGEPAKKEYRHFRIKTLEGPNDFASLAEAIGRRFTHGLQEKHERQEAGLPVEEGRFSKLPDLILIDGGPEQLLYARRAMLDAGGNVPMFGLAKRFEEIYLPGREEPIRLSKHSDALHLIQHVRDEAHRFGITRHRALRTQSTLKSELSSIPGIGPKRQVELLRHFGNIKAILEAGQEELAAVRGMNALAAKAVAEYAAGKEAAKPGM